MVSKRTGKACVDSWEKVTVGQLRQLQIEYKVDELSLLNLAITDGQKLVATRYSSHPEEMSNTLYYSQGSEVAFSEGKTMMLGNCDDHNAIIVASEKLTNYKAEWIEVPVNYTLLVDEEINVGLTPIAL